MGNRKDKEEKELISEEKIQGDMKQLEQENESLREQIAFLNKLEELERGVVTKSSTLN